MFIKALLSITLLGLLLIPIRAQTTIQVQSLVVPILDENDVPLFAGTTGAGDGDLVQIGYFSGVSTTLDPEFYEAAQWNAFTPITSIGGTHLVTIGDPGGVSGDLGLITSSTTFDDTGDSPPLPAVGARLGVRFYNDPSLAGSTHYNIVTSDDAAWEYSPPSVPFPFPNALNLDAGGVTFVWEDSLNPFQTSLLVPAPEPSTILLVLLGALSGFLPRRRR